MIIISVAFALLFLYLIMVLAFIIGWNRNYTFEPRGRELITDNVSVIIPVRNEEHNIRQLITCLAQQSYRHFEIIIVNDHSTDKTRFLVKQAMPSFPNLKLIDAEGVGKKNAIKEGIMHVSSGFIVTLDADCLPTFYWLESIVCFQKKLPSDLLVCPVKIHENDNFFLRVQALEFVSLVASGAGAAGIGMPVLCNGANLAFKKETWLKCQADLHEEEKSGDDIFLLQAIKKRKGVIRFLKSESAVVDTHPVFTLAEFIRQRRRWASKSPSYTDWHIIFVAVLVLTSAIAELVLLFNGFANHELLIAYGVFFVAKYLVDLSFLSEVQSFFHLKNVWYEALFLSVIYPFYIVFIAITGIVYKPKTW